MKIKKDTRVFLYYSILTAALLITYLIEYKALGNIKVTECLLMIYIITEFITFSWIAIVNITNKLIKKIILYYIVLYTAFFTLDFVLHTASYPKSFMYAYVSEGIAMIIIAMYYLYEQFSQENLTEYVYKKPVFWIMVAYLLMSSSNILTSLARSIYGDAPILVTYLYFLDFFTIVKNIMLCMAVMQIRFNSEYPTLEANKKDASFLLDDLTLTTHYTE